MERQQYASHAIVLVVTAEVSLSPPARHGRLRHPRGHTTGRHSNSRSLHPPHLPEQACWRKQCQIKKIVHRQTHVCIEGLQCIKYPYTILIHWVRPWKLVWMAVYTCLAMYFPRCYVAMHGMVRTHQPKGGQCGMSIALGTMCVTNNWCSPQVSLAACKDYQLSWESTDGGSMTKVSVLVIRFIRWLFTNFVGFDKDSEWLLQPEPYSYFHAEWSAETNPHPTLRDLLTQVSYVASPSSCLIIILTVGLKSWTTQPLS